MDRRFHLVSRFGVEGPGRRPASSSPSTHAARRARRALIALAASTLAAAASGQIQRDGVEFQVNTFTFGSQRDPALVTAANGDFVVVWESGGQASAYRAVFGRRFSSAGGALGTEFQINAYTDQGHFGAKIASAANGDFVVVWSDDYDGNVLARRFSSAGVALGAEFVVTAPGSHPKVAAASDGDFVVVWLDYSADGYGAGVFARRFSSSGSAIGGAFQVNLYTTGDQRAAAVASEADGDFLVAWQSDGGQDGSDSGIFARRFTSSGSAVGGEIQINAYTAGFQTQPSLATQPDGGFVVVWDANGQDGSEYGVFGRRIASSGSPSGAEFQVNTVTASSQRYAAVAANGGGKFVVSWTSFDQDGSISGVFARGFSSSGAAITGELPVNTYTPGQQRAPAVAIAGAKFVIAWQSDAQDGYQYGIFAQRFSTPITFDVDGDGTVQALTDMLLGLRYAFGFRGAILITGAVGAGCTRCDAPSIETYLAANTQ